MSSHDRSAILRTCELLFVTGQVVELRSLEAVTPAWRRPHTVSGYFDDWTKLAAAAAGLQARGIYVTLNPVNPDLLARANNRLRDMNAGDPATSDADIVARRWLPVDCDPVRPSGISATDAEHAAALARALEIRDYLAGRGWPDPLLADSGNGAHLLYRVDLPPDYGGLVEGVLAALAFRFSDEQVAVDQKNFNPARIWKLYGTLAAKGDPTPDRPHRLSRLLEAPGGLAPVPKEQLSTLVAELPVEPPVEAAPRTQQAWRYGLPARSFDLEQWIAGNGLDVREKQEWSGGWRWIFRVCPWNPEHRDRSAYIVQFASGAIAAGCHHNGCAGRDWHSLRDLVEPGWRERGRVDSAGQSAHDRDGHGERHPISAQETSGAPDPRTVAGGLVDGELRWGGRSGNRAYLRHGQLRYTLTPEGEGLRVKVAAGNRGSAEIVIDANPAEADLDALAGRVAGALDAPLAEVRADLAALPDQWAAHPAAAELPPPTDPQVLADFAPWVTARLNERATRAAKDVVGETICRWLLERDALVCDGDRGAPYLLADDGGMLALTDCESLALQAAVARCGVNPAEPAFDWLYHDLRTTAANEGRRVLVRRFSFSDPATCTVYASCGPRGYVVARPGEKLEWRRNGADDIVFAADAVLPEWDWQAEPLSPLELQAFQPALTAPLEVPDYTPEIQQAFLGVFLAGMIANLRPLPLLALLGNKGGGKSTLGRSIIRVIYGPSAGVTPLSDDPRDFWAMAKMRLCFALDNVDAEPPPWLVDALAVVATGGRKQSRKLYTDEELTDKEMRAAVVITSRTAPFARPDVAERILPLTTVEFSDARRRADSEIDREVAEYRSEVFAYLVTAAANMLSWAPQAPGELPARFLDFARLAWAWYAATGQAAAAIPALNAWRAAQALAVGDADPLLRAILEYAPESGIQRRTATDFVRILGDAGAALPHLGGGKAIAHRLRELRASLNLAGWELVEEPDRVNKRSFYTLRHCRASTRPGVGV